MRLMIRRRPAAEGVGYDGIAAELQISGGD